MIFISLKNLFQEKTRLLISIGGVAFSVLLILILQGLYQGFSYRMGEYIRSQPADFWVSDDKARDMFHSISILPLEYKAKIEAVAGVAKVSPFSARQIVVNIRGKREATYLVAYDSETGIGGPNKVVQGKQYPDQGEIIIDRVFANKQKLKIDDSLLIGVDNFKVAGISEGTNLVTFQYSFVTKQDAERTFKTADITNYFLVSMRDVDKNQVAVNIEKQLPGTEVFTKQEFVENNTEFIRETFLPIVLVLLIIGFAVGVAVIGLTIFTSTIEKAKEYGVLKAIGVKNNQLYQMVLGQAFVAGLIGYSLGVILAFAVNQIVTRLVPEFISLFRLVDFILVLGATLIMSLLAAYIPIRRIAVINPAEVFKA